jgi:hypothetical protein
MRRPFLVSIALLIAGGTAAQPDPWTPLRVFEGTWEGPATGQSGKGISYREYSFVLGGRFLSATNHARYEPKSAGVKPEVHTELGMFSYDRALKKVVLRQFHGEGFVNEYTLDSVSEDGRRLDFVTVRIENIAPGWRARESYQVVSRNEIVETFSLAAPGKGFEVYSETRLRRVV